AASSMRQTSPWHMSFADTTSSESLLDLARFGLDHALRQFGKEGLDLDQLVDDFVRQPLISRDALRLVESLYEGLCGCRLPNEQSGRDVAGVVGYCLLSQAMDSAAHRATSEVDVMSLLGDEHVIGELLRWYRYEGPTLVVAPGTPPLLGTTSFIVRCLVGSSA